MRLQRHFATKTETAAARAKAMAAVVPASSRPPNLARQAHSSMHSPGLAPGAILVFAQTVNLLLATNVMMIHA